MATKEQNQESIKNALAILNRIAGDQSSSRTVKKGVTDLVTELKNEEGALAVRAANAIGALDDITQDPNMASYIRTSLWQAVSILEGVRE